MILEHWQHPHNYGVIKKPSFHASADNPTCGDTITLFGNLVAGKITALSFTADGCAISIAAASLTTDYARNEMVSNVINISPEQLLQLIDLNVTPARLGCALLPYQAIVKALTALKN
jgi:nitrogen fixation NifU-like protein